VGASNCDQNGVGEVLRQKRAGFDAKNARFFTEIHRDCEIVLLIPFELNAFCAPERKKLFVFPVMPVMPAVPAGLAELNR